MDGTRKSNVKLNFLLDIEKQMQSLWQEEKIFEEDAPIVTATDKL
jgi:hypothetical protein